MFIGENLTNLRILYGYTRKQLAEKIGITEQGVWQYETGNVSPKLAVVNKLKRIFNVKSKFFYQKEFLEKYRNNVVNHNHIAYRSAVINSVKKTQIEAMHIDTLVAFINFISGYLRLPENRLKTLRDKVIQMLEEDQEDRIQQIRKVALFSRRFLGLNENNNNNLLFLLEKNGAFIFEKSMGEKIDAYSLWTTNNLPFIMLGNLKKSAARRNFDLAHELGHLLLHYQVEFSMLDQRSLREYEHEANIFAGEFLLPYKSFVNDVSHLTKISHPDSYIELKKKWLVSIQAMAYRVNYLDLMTYQQYRYFNILLNRLDYKKVEPLDRELPVARPGKFRSILQLLFGEKHIDLDNLLDKMAVDIEYLTNLTGIENEFYKKYQESTAKQFSIRDLKL